MNKIPQSEWHQSQRGFFAGQLYNEMIDNPDIWLLTGDLGFKLFDRIRDDFPDRFVNCGASEVTMMNMACGLALSGKIPFVYSISPFLIFRPFEVIRNINHEKIPVRLIGSGQDEKDYSTEGHSHYSGDIRKFLNLFENIWEYCPEEKEDVPSHVKYFIHNNNPAVMLLKQH